MTAISLFSRIAVAVFASAFLATVAAHAQGSDAGGSSSDRQGGGDGNRKSCSQAVVREAEGRTGGRVMSVSRSSQGGATVCEVTVLVPSADRGKPRRTVVTIRP